MYKFKNTKPHSVQLVPHGNAKYGRPYVRTAASTLQSMKKEASIHKPKQVVESVYSESGGVVGARSLGELPRNRKQVQNIRHQRKGEATLMRGAKDELFIAIEQCKMAEGTERFVQDVKAAPLPMAILAFDWQIDDLARFCTGPDNFTIMGVDPTFNLGCFYVTVTTYSHLLLEKRADGRAPTFIGPMLVHQTKDYAAYSYFFSTLIDLNKNLQNLCAFGTDGEKNLSDALARHFPFAAHVRCFRHLQRNVEDYLTEKKFPKAASTEYIQEIFGHRVCEIYYEGLVDLRTASEFHEKLTSLQSR